MGSQHIAPFFAVGWMKCVHQFVTDDVVNLCWTCSHQINVQYDAPLRSIAAPSLCHLSDDQRRSLEAFALEWSDDDIQSFSKYRPCREGVEGGEQAATLGVVIDISQGSDHSCT